MANEGGPGSIEDARNQLGMVFFHLPPDEIDQTLATVQEAMGPPAQNYFINLFNQCVDRLLVAVPPAQNNDVDGTANHPETVAPAGRDSPELKLDPAEIKEWIMDMHPRVDPAWVDSKISEGYTLRKLADFMMDTRNIWPKSESKIKRNVAARALKEAPEKSSGNFLTDYDSFVSINYQEAAEKLLASDFPRVDLPSVRKVLLFYNYHYAPAKKCLKDTFADETLPTIGQTGRVEITCQHNAGSKYFGSCSKKFQCRILLSAKRIPKRYQIFSIPSELEQELEWTKKNVDMDVSEQTGVVSTVPPSSLFECQICFEETPIDDCVNCENAHIFCPNCVLSHAKEVAYGQGRTSVDCLENNCDAGFSRNLLEKILDPEILGRLEERNQEENLNAADLEGLERCKYCNFALVIDVPKEVDKVLRCGNPECKAEICRQCGLDWDDDHVGVPCEEMERDEAAAARTEYEEKMTKEVVRYCPKCKIPITKVEGCNKMTCRCGQKMCYLCREKGIDYSHFCQHPLNPGQKCSKCSKCLLWEDPKNLDTEKLKTIEKEVEHDERIDQSRIGGLRVTEPSAPKRQRIDEPNNNAGGAGVVRNNVQVPPAPVLPNAYPAPHGMNLAAGLFGGGFQMPPPPPAHQFQFAVPLPHPPLPPQGVQQQMDQDFGQMVDQYLRQAFNR